MIERAEKPQKAQSALPPLPVLPVLRAENCDQAMTDANVAYLEKNRADLLQRLWREEGAHRTHEYYELAWEILDELNADGPGIPPSHIGRLDLALEISRRLRAAHGMGGAEAAGKPLAAKSGDPLPPLVALDIDERAKQAGLTQEVTDSILQEIYTRRPDLLYALAEEYRNDLLMTAFAEYGHLLDDFVEKNYPEAGRWDKTIHLRHAMEQRIRKMCGAEI